LAEYLANVSPGATIFQSTLAYLESDQICTMIDRETAKLQGYGGMAALKF
jgi:hypothetical protein